MTRDKTYIEKPSTPFSNGTEYEIFLYNYCEECKAFKLRDDMFPEFPEFGGCPILDKIEMARFDESLFPSNDILKIIDAETNEVISWHKCRKFKPMGKILSQHVESVGNTLEITDEEADCCGVQFWHDD